MFAHWELIKALFSIEYVDCSIICIVKLHHVERVITPVTAEISTTF